MDGRRQGLVDYGLAAAISIVAAVFLLELGTADLRVPFYYDGDALAYGYAFKSVVDHGWYWTNPSVGAPAGLELYDFPFVAHDSFHLLLVKAMSLFSGDWGLLFNLYFLLGFPLITLSAMAVFRHFRVGYGPAIVGSVLYSFLPSRLIKAQGHLFLDVFYEVPLAILVLLWVCGEDPPLARDRGGGRWPILEISRGRSLAALLICALSASTSLYYSFFAGCLLVAGGVWASVERRSLRNAVSGVALAGAIVIGLGANALPTVIYHLRHGPNAEVGVRNSGEAELYGMKIVQLLLPTDAHRLLPLRQIKDRYNSKAPLLGENGATSLGLVGDVGFLVLLGTVLTGRRAQRTPDELLRPLSVLNAIAVLLATIGGFGSLFAVLVSPQVRTYCRMNVLIGFFALFAVVILLERLQRRLPRVGGLALPVVLAVGLLDQSTSAAIKPYAATKKEYASDADLVHRIEATVPQGTAIFELPFVGFPEVPPVNNMSSFEPFRPYLHSRSLRWSFPSMRGRPGEAFPRDVSQREPSKMVETLAAVGFGGILINRHGYVDSGAAIEADLRNVLDAKPLTSESGLVFFSLADYRRARAELSPAELERKQHPIAFTFDGGFFVEEHDGNRVFRWSDAAGEIRVENETAMRRRVSVKMTLSAAMPPARLDVAGDLLSTSIDLTGPLAFDREIEIPPGKHAIRFACNGKRAEAPLDPRTLVWQVANFTFEELPLSPAQAH
jgi:phosphoglycerol transferase